MTVVGHPLVEHHGASRWGEGYFVTGQGSVFHESPLKGNNEVVTSYSLVSYV